MVEGSSLLNRVNNNPEYKIFTLSSLVVVIASVKCGFNHGSADLLIFLCNYCLGRIDALGPTLASFEPFLSKKCRHIGNFWSWLDPFTIYKCTIVFVQFPENWRSRRVFFNKIESWFDKFCFWEIPDLFHHDFFSNVFDTRRINKIWRCIDEDRSSDETSTFTSLNQVSFR